MNRKSNEVAVLARSPATEGDIATALSIDSSSTIEEIYKLVQQQHKDELDRTSKIDTKAASLLAGSAVAVTVLFGVANFVLAPSSHFHKSIFLSFVLGCALVAGLFASTCALTSARVRKVFAPRAKEIFPASLLLEIHELLPADPETAEEEKIYKDRLTTAEIEGVRRYRRRMTTHLWDAVKQTRKVNINKAYWLLCGQISLTVFTILVALLGGMMLITLSSTQ